LRYISNAGGTLPQAVLQRLRQALPTTQLFVRYGQTEAFLSTILPPADVDRKPTSMGKALPNTELFVINEHGQLCQPGEVGELVQRGPIISPGYWKQPTLTAQVFRPHPFLPPELGGTEKVCYSGDLVTMDDEGFYYFVGRRDAMIKSAGFRISPTEIEEVLFASGQVQHAAVIGIPDEVLGQHIKAFVVAQHDTCIDPERLLAFCAERLPAYMVPKSVDILPELPLTSNGKVDYPAFRRQAGLVSSLVSNEPQRV
jgi:acyl-CoA synthetase (AMP-forming)/AMP-acid ligase II